MPVSRVVVPGMVMGADAGLVLMPTMTTPARGLPTDRVAAAAPR
ncbi:hypothetical protein [Streptomyces sp. NPDC001450]